MKQLATFFLLMVMAIPATAQEKIDMPVGKFKATAPLAVKANDHIIIDASGAKGDVEFHFDKTAFPKERATREWKKLILSTSVNGKYTVIVISFDDKTSEAIAVTVTGGIDAPSNPPPDPPTGDVESLRSEMRASFAALIARVSALEGAKPPPPTTLLKHFTFVGAEATPTATAINNNASLRATLKAAGVAVHVVSASNLQSQSAGFVKAVNDNGGVPIVVMQGEDGAVIGTAAMSNIQVVTDAANKFLKR